MTQTTDFILFYDGNCPICQKEVAWLRWKNQQGKLGFQDINATDFDPAHYGKTLDDLMADSSKAWRYFTRPIAPWVWAG